MFLRAAATRFSTIRSFSTTNSSLKNGVKLVLNKTDKDVGAVSLFVEVGSRLEDYQSNGSSELIRRLAIKGNKDYILGELKSRGATIGSHTDHERTAYYSRCHSKDIPKVLEVLSKITSNLTFSEDVVVEQKNELINSIKQSQSEVSDYKQYLDEHLHSIAYQQCSLSLPVTGSQKSISSISTQDLATFYAAHYTTGRMVVAVSGNFDEQSLTSQLQGLFNFDTPIKVEIFEKQQTKEAETSKKTETTTTTTSSSSKETTDKTKASASASVDVSLTPQPAVYTGSAVKIQNDYLPYSHASIALQGPPAGGRDSIGIQLLLTLLGNYDQNASGGKAVESHFVSQLESDHGARSVRTFYHQYRDSSLFGVYGHLDPDYLWDFVYRVLTNFTRPLHGITDAELARAKSILLTRLSEQRNNDLCKNLYLSQNALYNSSNLEETIKSIGHKELADIVDRYVYDTDPALAAFGNMQYFPDYHYVRSWTIPKSL